MSETSLINLTEKIRLGCFYTTQNIFIYPHFQEWFTVALKASNNTVLEPFAGSNNLIRMLQNEGYNFEFDAYDVNPGSPEVGKKDTIKEFPQGYKLIITNPPYLAKNSAHRKKIVFPTTKHDDLYKLCLEIMLKNCDYVGAIIPASFINTDLFLDRLHSYTLLSSQMFTDTENPVCLALFSPQKSNSIYLYENDKYVSELYSLKKQVEKVLINNKSQPISITFNNKKGNLGLRAIDGTLFPTIAFIEASQVPENKGTGCNGCYCCANGFAKLSCIFWGMFAYTFKTFFGSTHTRNTNSLGSFWFFVDIFSSSFCGIKNSSHVFIVII